MSMSTTIQTGSLGQGWSHAARLALLLAWLESENIARTYHDRVPFILLTQ